jgi:DNA-binding LacI/PurR family transcriptional regulator
MNREPRRPKHAEIFADLHAAIRRGEIREGRRVPSENEIAARYGASRPTAARALRDLERMGLVERRVGSGTFVRRSEVPSGSLFGLLIPGLGTTEIFEPICGEIARELHRRGHTLLWGDAAAGRGNPDPGLEDLCRHYVERRIAGVFFAPLELRADKDPANLRVAERLAAAGIAMILLDRDLVPFPERSRYDLVAIDHRRAGTVLARHLLGLGARRIDFAARPLSAPTVDLRLAGVHDALRQAGILPRPDWVHLGDPEDASFLRRLAADRAIEAVICANDVTAGHLLHGLERAGRRVPRDVRVVGFDDVKYARLLRVPLTTYRQPCEEIGAAAVSAMMERVARPGRPGRDVLLDGELVVRQSCGATPRGR